MLDRGSNAGYKKEKLKIKRLKTKKELREKNHSFQKINFNQNSKQKGYTTKTNEHEETNIDRHFFY
jgi:hypothetical protein